MLSLVRKNNYENKILNIMSVFRNFQVYQNVYDFCLVFPIRHFSNHRNDVIDQSYIFALFHKFLRFWKYNQIYFMCKKKLRNDLNNRRFLSC